MRLGIIGSRRFPDLGRVALYIASLPEGTAIVTGGASGVDATAARSARSRGLPLRTLGPSFEEAADEQMALRRNQRLIDSCDVLVAFWDGVSSGTRMTVERALDSGREVHVYVVKPGPSA